MSAFTPVPALVGGLLIGASASAFLFLNGRIAGVSGLLGNAIAPEEGDRGWRLTFLAGLVVGGLAFAWVHPAAFAGATTGSLVPVVAAGLLVGFGTRLGGGCTSGHGVCGIARLSPRSIVATLVFVLAGALTVFVTRHLLGGAS
jgi:hypothetical protein